MKVYQQVSLYEDIKKLPRNYMVVYEDWQYITYQRYSVDWLLGEKL